MNETAVDTSFRRTIAIVALLNFAYFLIEMTVALVIGSASLFADSADFFEDAAVNILILAALGWTLASRQRVGRLLALVLLVPALAFLVTAIAKIMMPTPPAPMPLSLAGLGALAINLTCAYLLAAHRHRGDSLSKAAFLSARNDALANVAIVVAALVTALLWRSAWPDLIVGCGIAAMNLDAAKAVWTAAGRDTEPAA